MKTVNTISVDELKNMSDRMYGNLVKAVVDLERDVLVVDAEMHADQELLLLEQGSKQKDLWGINLYPTKFGEDDFIEFDSMINIKPSQQNTSRSVEDLAIREKIIDLVNSKVIK